YVLVLKPHRVRLLFQVSSYVLCTVRGSLHSPNVVIRGMFSTFRFAGWLAPCFGVKGAGDGFSGSRCMRLISEYAALFFKRG
ncbi:MAG: hypothetical protein ABGF52_08215, partial [Candidatus Asgardarchaeum sp.]